MGKEKIPGIISGRRPSFKVSLRSEHAHGPKVTFEGKDKYVSSSVALAQAVSVQTLVGR